MSKLTLYIQKGAFSLQDLEQIQEYTKQSKKDCFELTVAPVKSARSSLQNNYYHKLCKEFVLLAQERAIVFLDHDPHTHHSLDHWKWEHFKGFFNKLYLEREDPITGLPVVKGSSDLTVSQCASFLQKIIDTFVANGGVVMKSDNLYKKAMGIK